MATAEQLLVRIDATTEQLRRELKRADETVAKSTGKIDRAMKTVDKTFAGFNKTVSRAVKGLGALGLVMSGGALLRGAEAALDKMLKVQRSAEALGDSTKAIQELIYTFGQFDLESKDVSDALNTLSDRAKDAEQGTQSYIQDFKLLGVTVDDLRGKRPSQLFETMAAAVAQINDPTTRAAAVVRIFGDDLGNKLLPLLMKGREGLDGYRKEAEKFNIIVGEKQVKAAADAAEQLKKVRAIFDAQFNSAVAANAGSFDDLAGVFASDDFKQGMTFAVEIIGQLGDAVGQLGKEMGGLKNAGGGDFTALLNNSFFGLLYHQLTGEQMIGGGSAATGRIQRGGGGGGWGGNSSSGWIGRGGNTMSAPGVGAGGGGSVSLPPQQSLDQMLNVSPTAEDLANLDAYQRELAQTEAEFRSYEEANKKAGESVQMLDGYFVDYGVSLQDVQNLQDEMNQKTREIGLTAQEVGYTFASAFEDAVFSGKKLRDVLQGLAEDILRLILRQTVTTQVAGAVSSIITSVGSPGGGSGKAAGGAVSAGSFYRVNENGPEMLSIGGRDYLMMGNRGGMITPNNRLGGGGGNVTVHQQINVQGAGDKQLADLVSHTTKLATKGAVGQIHRELRAGGTTRQLVRR